MADLRAPEQNRLLGRLADMLRMTEGQAAAPEFLPPQLNVMNLVRQLMLPSAETVEKMSYGDPLFRMPQQSRIPITTDKQYLADIAGMVPFTAPAARPSARAIQDLVREIQTTQPVGAINVAGLPNKGKDFIQSSAEELSAKLKQLGFQADVTHSGSAAGPSSYVRIYDPETGRMFTNQIRFSGHSKGPRESAVVTDIQEPTTDIPNIVQEALEMRSLGPSEAIIKAAQRQSIVDELIASGKAPRQAYKEADKRIAGLLDQPAQNVTPSPKGRVRLPGQGLIEIKQNAKKLSEKDFLDTYVTQTLPEHLTSKNFPIGVKKQEPHEFLPPSMLDPSEWDSWSDRSMSGTVEKVNQFRRSLKEGAKFPPVLVHSQKGDFPYVEDGHHRMAAYIDEGYKTVPVSFDISSLIKIWKEENQSPRKVSDIYKDYTQGLLNSQPANINSVELFLNKAEKFPSDYIDIAPQEAVIDVSKLVPTQKKVSQIAVDQYKAGSGPMGDLPIDVVFDTKTNQYLIVDGHHRVAAMIELGIDEVPVQIIGEK